MTKVLACAVALTAIVAPSTRAHRVPAREPSAGGPVAASTWTADALVARVVNVRKAERFRIRATMTRSTPGGGAGDVRQLLIQGRRERDRGTLLYRQLWPVVAGGRALVVEDTGEHGLRGFQYEAGTVTSLTDGMLGERFFASDLRIEDLAEGFWFWRSRTIVGEEAVGEHQTVIVDLRPGPGTPTTYSKVKAWLSPDLAIGLRMEQYGRDGHLAKRIGLYRILKVNDRWMPGIITVEPGDGRSRTVIEGVKFEQDVSLRHEDFTVAGVRRVVSGGK